VFKDAVVGVSDSICFHPTLQGGKGIVAETVLRVFRLCGMLGENAELNFQLISLFIVF
jgi:hypothetical protein